MALYFFQVKVKKLLCCNVLVYVPWLHPYIFDEGKCTTKGSVFFFTLFQFWLKFGCSRLSLTLGATDLSCAASVFDQVATCGFGLQPKMRRHGANTAV